MTPQEKDRIECAIRHIQTATDVDPWAAEIAVEALEKQLSNVSEIPNSSDDLISRQTAINYVDDIPYIKEHPNLGLIWKEWIEALPSVKPDSKESSLTQKALDSISRVDAIDAIKTSRYLVDAMEKIIRLPSVQPEQRWIPCSERLPENDESVLISHSHGVTKAWWNGRFWTSIAIKNYKTVTAWMPLPEPAKLEND